MAAAVAIQLLTVLAVMGPSFVGLLRPQEPVAFGVVTGVVFVHVALGLTTLVLGIWLVAKWRLSKETCSARKRVMKVTLGLWVTNFLLGVIIYIAYWILPSRS